MDPHVRKHGYQNTSLCKSLLSIHFTLAVVCGVYFEIEACPIPPEM